VATTTMLVTVVKTAVTLDIKTVVTLDTLEEITVAARVASMTTATAFMLDVAKGVGTNAT